MFEAIAICLMTVGSVEHIWPARDDGICYTDDAPRNPEGAPWRAYQIISAPKGCRWDGANIMCPLKEPTDE